MLDAIGVGSVDELFEDIPESLRLGRPLDLPDGMAETDVYDRLRELAGRNTDAESEVSFLGAGMATYVPAIVDGITSRSGVSDPYALPARGLAGRAAGDVRVPDGDVGADRTAGLERGAVRGSLGGGLGGILGDRGNGAREAGRIPRPAPAQPRDDGDLLGRLRLARGRGSRGRGRHRRHRAGGGRRRGHRGDLHPAAELPGSGRGRRGARSLREGEGRAGDRRLRPDRAVDPEATGRVRRRHRRRGGSAARQPARLRRALVRVLLRDRGASAPDAGQDCRRSERRRRAARVRADAADARAAHPPREGDPQHLHRPSPERAGGDHPPELARQTWLRRVGRAARAPHRLRARPPGGGQGGRAAARGAGGARVRRGNRDPGRRVRRQGSAGPMRRRGRRGGLSARARLPRARERSAVAITERRSRADIDRLADVLGRAIGMGDAAEPVAEGAAT